MLTRIPNKTGNYFCFSSKWQKAVELPGNKCEGRVPDLTEGMKYQFRVIAVNKGGQSKPSEPSDPIIAKDRNGQCCFFNFHNTFLTFSTFLFLA